MPYQDILEKLESIQDALESAEPQSDTEAHVRMEAAEHIAKAVRALRALAADEQQ